MAVLLVVLYHAGVPGFSGGYVGVDVFFVLSGYLITGILAAEVARTGRLDLPRFYARRVRRLLPAMAVLLLAVTVFAYLFYAPPEQGTIAETTLATAGYFSNFHFAAGATDYLAADAETNPLLHTWSLSVEEQFYFVWPLLVLLGLAGLRRRDGVEISYRRLMWVMAAVCVASFVLTLFLMGSLRTHWAFFSSPTRAWEFAVGGLGALVPRLSVDGLRRGRIRFGSLDEVPPAGRVLGWLGLAAVLVAGTLYDARTPFPGWAALLPALGTVFALRAGTARTDTPMARVLAWRPLQELGRLSYSWYLWHWPVLVFAAGLEFTEIHELPALYRLALVLLSLGLAEASYRFVEDPARHQRWVSSSSRRSLALGVLLTAFGVALALAWGHVAGEASRAPDQVAYAAAASDGFSGCITRMSSTDITDCAFGDTTSTTTVVLLGDSHAHHWLPALVPIAKREGWRLIPLLKSGCAIIDETEWERKLNRPYYECDEWKEAAFSRIAALSPDLLIATFSVANSFTDEQWVGGTTRTYRTLLDVAPHVVHLRDVPRPNFDVPACLSRAAWRKAEDRCAFDPSAHPFTYVYELVEEGVQTSGAVASLDLSSMVCPGIYTGGRCDVERDGMVLYQDRHHLTATFVASLAPALADALRRSGFLEAPTAAAQRTPR